MAILVLQEQDATLGVRSGALVVTRRGEVVRLVPLHDVSEVQVYGDAQLTPAARGLLLRHGVEVIFLSPRGLYQGRLVGEESANAARRVAQYRFLSRPEGALEVGRAVVAGKLLNQRAVLRRVHRHRPSEVLAGVLGGLRRLAQRSGEAEGLDALRGVEGQGARLYFEGLRAAITHPVLAFEGRSRRPPRDPVNACLSLGYTLLLRRVESAVRKVGLDPHLGALHAPGRGRPALALDLLEEFRAPGVDRVVLRLVNRQQLQPSDFATRGGWPGAGPWSRPPRISPRQPTSPWPSSGRGVAPWRRRSTRPSWPRATRSLPRSRRGWLLRWRSSPAPCAR